MLVRWLVFIHIPAALTFFLAHGATAAMAFRLRKEPDLERIRALLDLSGTTIGALTIAYLIMGITGLVMPFFIQIWGKAWVWLSIILILFVGAWMAWFNEKAYKPLRRLVGLPYMVGGRNFPTEPPASPQAIIEHIHKINVIQLGVVGYVIPMFVLWLMVFKPF